MYRAAMRFIGRTYGRFSEYLDAYEAFMWNVYVDGIPLARHEDKLGAFMSGRASVDFEGMLSDLIVNEMVDRAIGRLQRGQVRASKQIDPFLSVKI
jgi:hypothetical protein